MGFIDASRGVYLAAVVSLALAGCGATHGRVQSFQAVLSGSSEVPPVAVPGYGLLNLSYDAGAKQLSWTGTYRALTGEATSVEIRGAAGPGEVAGIQFPISPVRSPFRGSTKISGAQDALLAAGLLYVTIATKAHPSGEIRGQIVRVQIPGQTE